MYKQRNIDVVVNIIIYSTWKRTLIQGVELTKLIFMNGTLSFTNPTGVIAPRKVDSSGGFQSRVATLQ